ncbi:MAG: DUF5309 family protein [Phycisphaerales bacterium]|nr:DUF5309 family protein [Phycisphaerales bacterium]
MLTMTSFNGPFTPEIANAVLFRQAANYCPIYALLQARGLARMTVAEKFEWYTSEHLARSTAINNGGAAYDANTTSIVVDDGSVFFDDSLILFEATGEVGLVTDVSGNTLTVVRGIGAVVASHANSVANDAPVRCLGSAAGEAAPSPVGREVDLDGQWNYVQTFREAVELSGRKTRVKTDTQDERPRQRMAAFQRQIASIEHAIIFGARGAVAGAEGRRVTTTGGIRQTALSNRVTGAGAISRDDFNDLVRPIFEAYPGDKVAFCGSVAVNALNALWHNAITVVPTTTLVGLDVRRILTPYGAVDLIHHHLLKGAYAGDILALDPSQIAWRFTDGGQLQILPDTQAQGDDAKRDEVFAEGGFEAGDEVAHAVIEGVTGIK